MVGLKRSSAGTSLHGATFAKLSRISSEGGAMQSLQPSFRSASQSTATSSDRVVCYEETNRFTIAMEDCCVKLSNSPDQPSLLSCEPVAFVQKLTAMCDEASDKKLFVDLFIDGFSKYIRAPRRLHAAAMPTVLEMENAECETIPPASEPNESIIRLLLKVDALQWRVSEAVLDRFVDALHSESPLMKDTLSTLIVDQFRYLDTVKDGEKICHHFIDVVMPMCGSGLKTQILSCLPQLIDGCHQAEDIAVKIKLLIDTDKAVIDAALEAISNLPLSVETLSDLHTSITDSFADYAAEDKVSAFKFLLETAEAAGNVDQFFCSLRELNFGACFGLRGAVAAPVTVDANGERATQAVGSNSDSASDAKPVALSIAKALEFALNRNKTLSDSATRVQSAACGRRDKDNMFDILILLILYSSKQGRSVLALIRQKLRTGCWKTELLDECFRYPGVMTLYTENILSIADCLIRSPERRLAIAGADLYQRVFFSVDDLQRQDILAALMMHVSTGNEQEVNVALDALHQLTLSKEMNELATVLQGLLEIVSSLNLYQVRKVFGIFGQLSRGTGEDDTAILMEDLHLFVRKNMNFGTTRQKGIAVLAALTLYRHISTISEMKDQATTLYKTAESASSSSVALRTLFYDEVANAVQAGAILDDGLLVEIRDKLADILDRHFLVSGGVQDFCARIETGGLFGADESQEPQIGLKVLLDGTCGNLNNSESSPTVLPPLLRLYLVCEWNRAGNLNEVDLLLSAPFILYKRQTWSDIADLPPSEQQATCLELLQCANSLIELLNGLARIDPTNDSNGLTMQRLADLITLEKEFESCLRAVPAVAVPSNELDGSSKGKKPVPKPAVQKKAATKNTQPKKAKTIKKKADRQTCTNLITHAVSTFGEPEQIPPTEEDEEQPGPSKKATRTPKKTAPNTKNYFRELDAPVFYILRRSFVCQVEESTVENQGRLTPSALVYLLRKLASKLLHLSTSSANKRGLRLALQTRKLDRSPNADLGDSEASLKQPLQEIVPYIWKHLLTCLNHFKTVADDNDGIVDAHTSGMSSIARCVELCLDCLSSYLAWLDENEPRSVMNDVLSSFIKESTGGNETNENLVNVLIDELTLYVEYVPTLTLAVSLLRGINSLVKLDKSDEKVTQVAEIAGNYLKREWDIGDSDCSPGVNNALATVLELAFNAPNITGSLDKIEDGIKAMVAFIHPGSNVDVVYKCVTKSTLTTWYRLLFVSLAKAAKSYPRLNAVGAEAWLTHWVKVATCFRLIVRMVQANSPRQILSSALFHSCGIIQLFTNQVVSVLEKTFLDIYPKNVQQMFTVVQHSTRILHDICLEAKIAKDGGLMKSVPPLKRALEALVFRVKAMMATNNCADAMTIGLLKNKNLQGDVILSQQPFPQSICSEPSTVDSDDEESKQDDSDKEEGAAENENMDLIQGSDVEDVDELAVGDEETTGATSHSSHMSLNSEDVSEAY